MNASRYRALVAIQGLDPGRFAEATSEALARSGGGDPAPAVQRALPQQQQQRKKRAATPFELLALLKPEATPSGDGDAAAMALSPTLLPDLGYQVREERRRTPPRPPRGFARAALRSIFAAFAPPVFAASLQSAGCLN